MKQPLIITKFQLLTAARRVDCCREYQRRIIKAKTLDELIGTYKDGLRFCLANDYPKKEYILQHFDREGLHRHGIFVDEQIDGMTHNRTMVALGCCHGTLEFDDWEQRNIAIKHTGRVNVVAKNHTFIIVYIYDRAEVNIHLGGNASVVAYVYEDADKPIVSMDTGCRATYKIIHRDILKKL